MPNIYTKRIEKALDLTLTVGWNTMTVDILQPDSGETDRLVFSRSESRDDIVKRIGSEVLSWLNLMEDEFDGDDDE